MDAIAYLKAGTDGIRTSIPAIKMAGAASGEPSWLELSRVATDKDIVNGRLPMSNAYGITGKSLSVLP